MATAKVVKLTASPSTAANLSFEVGGIIKTCDVAFGDQVAVFDFDSLNAKLGSATATFTIKGSKGIKGPKGGELINLLGNLYNSLDITQTLGKAPLVALRSEGIKASLDRICALRANAYYTKYQNQTNIIAQARSLYSANNATSKAAQLATLSAIASQQDVYLTQAYQTDNRDGVVKSTTIAGTAADSTLTITDYGYRVPQLEVSAQNAQAQLGLIDEQFKQFVVNSGLPRLEEIFTNELLALDMNVKRLQVDFLNTILLSPIAGVVTGIYKQPGEAVLAGEPVLRVENDATVYVSGVLVYAGMISVGAAVTIGATLFDAAAPTELSGKIVAARWESSKDDRWAVIASCPNRDAQGKSIVPLGYCFDYNDTTVTIT